MGVGGGFVGPPSLLEGVLGRQVIISSMVGGKNGPKTPIFAKSP